MLAGEAPRNERIASTSVSASVPVDEVRLEQLDVEVPDPVLALDLPRANDAVEARDREIGQRCGPRALRWLAVREAILEHEQLLRRAYSRDTRARASRSYRTDGRDTPCACTRTVARRATTARCARTVIWSGSGSPTSTSAFDGSRSRRLEELREALGEPHRLVRDRARRDHVRELVGQARCRRARWYRPRR